jgi:putative CocE/NonD family hydrolase
MPAIESVPEFDYLLEENVIVTMRDGIPLATDIYFPARGGEIVPGPYPVLLQRTPYNKSEVERSSGDARWFACRGYVAVMQDCRGCYLSDGDVNFLVPEAEDGYDTLEWLGEQEWCNGNVGMWGTSWAGWTQTAPAALGAKNLATMIPNQSGANGHTSSVRQGGAIELRFIAWAFWHSATNSQKKLKSDPSIDPALNLGATPFGDWLTRMPIRKGQTQLKLVPPYEKFALEILSRSDYDEYWKHPSLAPIEYMEDFPDIPVLFVGGWYDSYTRSTFENFVRLSSLKNSPVRVLVGPWTHGGSKPDLSYAGDAEFGDTAALNSFRQLHLRWYDCWMKGMTNEIESAAPIRIFVMGGGGGDRAGSGRLFHGGRWRDEYEWPLARTEFTHFFLHEDGSLNTEPPVCESSSTTYQFDPSNPVPSLGGNVSSLVDLADLPPSIADPTLVSRGTRIHEVMKAGGYNQVEGPDFYGCELPYLPIGSRGDVLVFETEPLETDLEITGPIEVTLWVSSTAPDTDFTAKLIDAYPPSKWYPFGYALNLTDSIMRLRYRNGPEKQEFLTPGERDKVVITLYPTSNLFAAGHRIRLDISSSNFPRFDVNPNTGEPIGKNRGQTPADNTIYHEALHPSSIKLPIIPRL